jgi:hypothetical protein
MYTGVVWNSFRLVPYMRNAAHDGFQEVIFEADQLLMDSAWTSSVWFHSNSFTTLQWKWSSHGLLHGLCICRNTTSLIPLIVEKFLAQRWQILGWVYPFGWWQAFFAKSSSILLLDLAMILVSLVFVTSWQELQSYHCLQKSKDVTQDSVKYDHCQGIGYTLL